MRPHLLIHLFLAAALSLQGCATFFGDKDDEITVQSNPPGAEVWMGITKAGVTPYTFRLKRNTFEQTYVTLKMEGYESHKFMVQKTIETTSLFNLGFTLTTGGVTCFGIDALSGAMMKYSPTGYLVDLKRQTASAPGTSMSPAAFAARSGDELRQDIARGDGEFLRAYHSLAFPALSYADFMATVAIHRERLSLCVDGVRLHQSLKDLFGA
jgi:hypothetical protein